MIDPRSLAERTLPGLDPTVVHDDYDVDEPLELEGVAISATDAELLRDVPISVDQCRFVGCDLSIFTFVSIRNTLLATSKLRVVTFSRSLQNVVFQGCRMDECFFRMITLKQVTFENSTLTDCDFYGSTLERLAFPASTFHGVGFDQCEIDGMDMTEATDLMIGDPRTLRGASISEHHVQLIALRLAQLSGIDVDES